jgi:hypothetical protein
MVFSTSNARKSDRVAEEWRRAGIEVDDPRDKDYGRREGSFTDPNGNSFASAAPFAKAVPALDLV